MPRYRQNSPGGSRLTNIGVPKSDEIRSPVMPTSLPTGRLGSIAASCAGAVGTMAPPPGLPDAGRPIDRSVVCGPAVSGPAPGPDWDGGTVQAASPAQITVARQAARIAAGLFRLVGLAMGSGFARIVTQADVANDLAPAFDLKLAKSDSPRDAAGRANDENIARR